MSEQELDGADVGAGLQEVDREGMPRRCGVTGLDSPESRDVPSGRRPLRASLVIGWPDDRPGRANPSAAPPANSSRKIVQQRGREHHVTVFLAFALLHAMTILRLSIAVGFR